MKKIFTFFMAMVVALAMYAVTPNQSGKKVDPTGHATELTNKKLAHHKQVAKVLGMDNVERKDASATKVAPVTKVTQNEVITLNYDGFAGMKYYEEDEDWWIGMSCDDTLRYEYGHNLHLEWKAPADNPFGTFTTKDFVYEYTHLTTPRSFGSILFEEMTMTLSYEKVSANLKRYTLTATLVGEDGFTYQVNAVHEEVVPKGLVEEYIEDAIITTTARDFILEGQNKDLDITLVVGNKDIIGAYGLHMIDWENSKISYKGTEVTPITFKAIVNLATHTETNALAYVTEVNMLGKDTVDYHFILAAPLYDPTDTIELAAIDLEVDDSNALYSGVVDFYATTPEFSIRGGWQADMAEEGTYKAAIFLDDADMNTITSLQAKVVVTLDKDNDWAIEGTMLGNDNIVYNLHLSRTIPEQIDTIVVEFENSAVAKYYPYSQDGENDIQLLNENDTYQASINVINVELGGEFDAESLYVPFTYLQAVDGSKISVAAIHNGKLYQVGDTTKIEADFLTFEGTLYQVKLWYAAPTPKNTVVLTMKNAECYLDFDYASQYTLLGYSEDTLYSFAVTVPAMSKEDIAGTFVNDGMFGKFGEGQYSFDASNSFVGKYNKAWEEYDRYYIQKGQFTVALDEDDNIILTGSVVCDDSIQYEVTLTSKYIEPHIEYDSENGAIDRIYSDSAEVRINDYIKDFGLVSLRITDPVEGDVTAVYFVLSEADAETIIPMDTYEINSTREDGTVLASIGIEWDSEGNGSVIPSYYARYVDGLVAEPFYFFQEGTVVVDKDAEGKLTFEINAVNSCGIPVHIVYGTPATGMENINVSTESVKKQIIEGQLVIIRDGKAYNAIGAQVK